MRVLSLATGEPLYSGCMAEEGALRHWRFDFKSEDSNSLVLQVGDIRIAFLRLARTASAEEAAARRIVKQQVFDVLEMPHRVDEAGLAGALGEMDVKPGVGGLLEKLAMHGLRLRL